MGARISQFLGRIRSDVFAGRNLDAYVVVAIGIALVIIDVIGDVNTETQLTVIIAALVVLVLRATSPGAKRVELEDILKDRRGYGPFQEFLKGGSKLWVSAPSAINILRDPAPIKTEILDRGGEAIFLLQNPNEAVEIKRLQQQLDIAALELTDDIRRAARILDTMKNKGKVDYAFLGYNPGFSLIIVDPHKTSGRLIVEFFGFESEFIGNRMHIEITARESDYWFHYWVDQFTEMQKVAIPVDPSGSEPPQIPNG